MRAWLRSRIDPLVNAAAWLYLAWFMVRAVRRPRTPGKDAADTITGYLRDTAQGPRE